MIACYDAQKTPIRMVSFLPLAVAGIQYEDDLCSCNVSVERAVNVTDTSTYFLAKSAKNEIGKKPMITTRTCSISSSKRSN